GTKCHNHDFYSTGQGNHNWVVTRRAFLKTSVATLAGLAVAPLSCTQWTTSGRRQGTARFGIVTDSHYADSDTVGSRYYRHSLDKMNECVELMNEKKVNFLIELGDFKDQDNPPIEQKTITYLRTVEKVFQKFNGSTYHVLGNHDIDSISKDQFLINVENTKIDREKSYYSFDSNGVHFVILDANYKSDGTEYNHGNFDWTDANIPPAEINWLRRDLAAARGPVIVFIHQLLDGTGSVYVNNAAAIRQILEKSSKVRAVFQGHHHEGNYSYIEGIHYYTLKAMVEGPGDENNSYAIVEILPDQSITVTGYRKAVSKQLDPAIVKV
ncbi:MAG: alkaline phosphatase, partial [Phycisphaerae bacterium]|nr:alkaline phosphatase [Phycisphaerae bacterium]NIW70989.1 alkaline phosphatase [candidate division KSB1 bacterium]NIP54355.1 alkaline phosphatase [Phycisphaerae bacterium]NIS53222.1 alkaline phosphatase [Phycisphaerae bacterium]NIU08854.1 alkaline phosphatase [Phycisphaerae bacterium]